MDSAAFEVKRVEAYSGFAQVYDRFMEDVPYEEWVSFLKEQLRREDIRDGLVLELGCGTGKVTEMLAAAGYDMIGIDNSEEMLSVARGRQLRQKEEGAQPGPEILYLEQDMREFELYGTVRAVVSVADTMNYLTDPEDFTRTLSLVNNYLDPGGIFLFDLKTVHYFKDVMGDQIYAENAPDASLIWENAYYPEEQMNEYALTLFLQREKGLFERCEEVHYQRAYTQQEIQKMAEQAGMEFVLACDGQGKPWIEGTERAYVILREQGKNRKAVKAHQ